jgi:hypothetical protein
LKEKRKGALELKNDFKSRFNDKRPFDVVRAEDFGGDLYEFYEPLEELIRKISGVNIVGGRPVFLIGGRGTGKTMVLKSYSLEMKLKDFIKTELDINKSIEQLNNEEMKRFLSKNEFIGIYLRFRTTEYDCFKGEVSKFFKPYLSLKIAEQIFESMKLFKLSGLLSEEDEFSITSYFANQVGGYENDKYDLENILKFIREDLFRNIELIIELNSYYTLEEIKKDNNIPVLIYRKILFDFVDFLFTELEFLNGKFLYVILDELEYLNDYQKGCIGEFVKNSDETSVIFKIGSRYMPHNLAVGQSNEVLQESHDYLKINISDALNVANNNDYLNLVKNILNKRLEKSESFKKAGITDIEQLFPNRTVEEEAIELVQERCKHWDQFKTYLKKNKSKKEKETEDIISYLEYPDNPIIEKLNMLLYYRDYKPMEINQMFHKYLLGENQQYSELYSKNSLNLLFQLYSDYRAEKKYDGIDTYIYLSSGIIRNVILLCNEALNTAYNYGYNLDKDDPIEVRYQDYGAKNYSKLQYESITQIPNNIGLDVQNFINEIGNIFRKLHLDPRLTEPEPTHFETTYSKLNDRAKKIFEAALNYSFLQKKNSMAPKNKNGIKKDDYLINRSLAPYFKISYRLRGRTYISPYDISVLISDNEDQKKGIRKSITQSNSEINENFENGFIDKTFQTKFDIL